jgi:hypothetical protein
MAKVALLLPATLHCLNHHAPQVIVQFLDEVPPTEIDRYTNASQFHDFLQSTVAVRSMAPDYILDLCNCEILLASHHHILRHHPLPSKVFPLNADFRACEFRTCEHVVLYRCRYDVRELLGSLSARPPAGLPVRDAVLAVTHDGQSPRLFEIADDVHSLLEPLRDWTKMDVDDPSERRWIIHMCNAGLIEVRECASAL